jgi:hypothetical protein
MRPFSHLQEELHPGRNLCVDVHIVTDDDQCPPAQLSRKLDGVLVEDVLRSLEVVGVRGPLVASQIRSPPFRPSEGDLLTRRLSVG